MIKPETFNSIDYQSVIIRWTVPADGSSAILAYQVLVEGADGEFYEDSVNCDGSQQSIMDALECNIPIEGALLEEPYNLPWGSAINAKVVAINLVGASTPSEVGGGTIILRAPYPPTDLVNVPLVTRMDRIGLDW